MPATPSLADLRDGRFDAEPKPKKVKGVVTPAWSLNSRHLMVHFLFNVLGEKAPRNTPKGKLPSIDAGALEKMESPFAARLIAYRSACTAANSLRAALTFVCPGAVFAPGGPGAVHHPRAVFRFSAVGRDNVERVFAKPKISIPLNLTKDGRRAFIAPQGEADLALVAADPRNLAVLGAIHDASPLSG